jgi:hypothetical protein
MERDCLAVKEEKRTADCGPHVRCPEETERMIRDRAISNWTAPQHITYSSKLLRFRSFIHWPQAVHPTPELLSIAGFFYTGKNFLQLFKTTLLLLLLL